MKRILIALIMCSVFIPFYTVIYQTSYEQYSESQDMSFNETIQVFCTTELDPNQAEYALYPTYCMNDTISLKINKNNIQPNAEHPIDNYKINWGDGTATTNWFDDTIHTFTHNYPYSSQRVTYQITLTMDVHTIHGNSNNISRALTIEIFPLPTEKLLSRNCDELYYYDGNNNSIKEPILLIEGFDPTNDQNIPFYYHMSPDFINDLISNYNVYFLNYNDGGSDMRENAMRTLGALRFIGQRYPLSQGIRAVGISMGGVTLRYGLAFAEEHNINHFTSTFISLDSPQRGAYMNSNLLSTLHLILENVNGVAALQGLSDVLQAPATKQLLRSNPYATENREYALGSNDFLSFYSELNPAENETYQECTGITSSILNNDPSNLNNKPGFPYKFNSIKSLGFSNGKGIETQNLMNLSYPNYLHMHLNVHIPGFNSGDLDINIPQDPWDTRPGSMLTSNIIDYHYYRSWFFNQCVANTNITSNYDAAFIHSFSSMDLQDYNLLQHPNQFTDTSSSRFSEIFKVANNTYPLHHTEISTIGVAKLNDWFSQIQYYSTGAIKGQLQNCSNATVKEYIGSNLIYQGVTDATGNYSVLYPLISSSDIRLVFEKAGYYTKSSQIHVTYNNTASAITGNLTYTNPAVNMYMVGHNNEVNISKSQLPQGNLYSIQEGIDFALSHNIPRIKIYTGTYQENIIIMPPNSSSVTELEILGSGIGTKIEGNDTNSSPCVMVLSDSSCPLNLKIRNLVIQNGNGGGIYSSFAPYTYTANTLPPTEILIEDCEIKNCSNGSEGIGINSVGPIHLERVKIMNNSGVHNASSSYWSKGGGAYLTNSTIFPTTINNCEVSNNAASEAGGLYISGTGKYIITNTTFMANKRYNNPINGTVNNVLCENVHDLLMSGNILINDGSPITQSGNNLSLLNCGSSSLPCQIINNLVTGNIGTMTGYNIGIKMDGNHCYVNLKNDIIQNNVTGIEVVNSQSQLQMKHCIFWNNVQNNTSHNFVGYNYSQTTNPNCFIDVNPNLDANYYPIWNNSIKSICIDSGDPNALRDVDGTPADIGAKPTFSHAYWKYTFRSAYDENQQTQRNEVWHWVSYPVINTVTNGSRSAKTFFNELLGQHSNSSLGHDVADVLQDIQWREDNVQHDILWHDDDNNDIHEWAIKLENSTEYDNNLSHHSVISQQGYKVQLIPFGDAVPTHPESVILHESGQAILPASYVDIHGSANLPPDQPYENWIGYFSPECLYPEAAFASIWDDIIMIKAKDWCLYRSRSNSDFSGIEGRMYPLKCGDMVIVVTNYDHPQFQWNYQNPVDPDTKPHSEYFRYDEKPDYVPVTIDFAGIEKVDLKEVALKLNGICKGAVVVKSDVEQLCAYLGINEKLTEGNVELIYYYDHGKNQPQVSKTIPVTKNLISCEYINGGTKYPSYTINAANLGNETVPVTMLEQNYPNPFNGMTKINYSLKGSGNMSLDIFNVKGQLVKTIFSGKSVKGSFSTTWDGKDDSGKLCSSGIYFCKLRTEESTQIRRMMLMK